MAGSAVGLSPKCMTVEQAFTQYIESRSNILSPSTIRGYKIIRDTRLQPIKDIYISDLKLNDIQMAINHDSLRLSRKSIKSAVSLLKSVLDMQDIDINIKKITLPQNRTIKKPIPTAEIVLNAIIGTEIELPCLLAMWLSLRISEVRGLQFKDISRDRKSITVCRARICLYGKDVVREQNKTAESTRTNFLPPYILNLIDEVPHEKNTDFIVQQSYSFIRKHFRKIMDENGLDITFHKLRHEFATTLNDLGIPSDYIQKLGGWATDNVMKTVYTHTTSEKESEYQKKINSYFNLLIENNAKITRGHTKKLANG